MLDALSRDAWADSDIIVLLRLLREADPRAPIVADGLGAVLDRETFWRIACGVSQVAVTAPGAAFAVMLPAGALGQAWLCGAFMAGRPFALLDARDPAARSAEICEALGLTSGLTEPGTSLPSGLRSLPSPSEAEVPATIGAAPDEPAIMVATSGSTGRPKGIVHARRGLMFRARQLAGEFDFRPGSVSLSTAASASISGLVHGFAALLSGALLLRVDVNRLGLTGVLRTAEDLGGATALQGLPSVLAALLATPGAAAALSGVARCQSSGAQLLAADVQALRNALPSACQLTNVYGLTEAPALLRWDVRRGWQPDGPRIPAGVELDGQRVSILDENGTAVAPGEVGELVAQGRYIALGEWLDGRLVAGGRIAPAPNAPGERVLRTGDLARLRADGLYEIVGRADRQVKIGGRRVELEEIEDRLRRAPGVAAAAVLADRDAPGGARVYAAVAALPDAPSSLEETLRRDLRAALPGYMQPARLIALPDLPRLPGGKVDGVALLTKFRTLPPPIAASEPLDARLARAWRTALGRAPEPGVTFQDAGGNSLGFLQLVLDLERATGHPAVMSVLHEGMTAAEMSAAIAAPVPGRAGPRVLLLPGNGGDSEPLARVRDGCPALDIVVAHYPSWRDFARGGAEVEVDAAALLPQALAVFEQKRPPILAGYSYGGAVAHALARLMAAQGRPVRALLLIDPGLGGVEPAPTESQAGSGAARDSFMRALRWRFRWAGQSPRRARWAARLLPTHPPPGLPALRLWRELELSLRERAMQRWAAGPVHSAAVPATLFLSEERRPGVPRDLGWGARCELRAIVPVRGTHLGMVRPPHRAALCVALTEAVLEARHEQDRHDDLAPVGT